MYLTLGTTYRYLRYLHEPSKLQKYVARPPNKGTTSWNRIATNIKGEAIVSDKVSKHIESLKSSYDPSDHITKLEEELCEEMAAALGRSGSKCDHYYNALMKMEKYCEDTLQSSNFTTNEKMQVINNFNELLVKARNAREELIIHRQAIGFVWRNQKIVEDQYPMPARKSMP